MDVDMTGMILTNSWTVNRDFSCVKIKEMNDIRTVAQSAVENKTDLTFRFGPSGDPIYSFTAKSGEYCVSKKWLFYRSTSGERVVVRCKLRKEKCTVNNAHADLQTTKNNVGESLMIFSPEI
ncbi:MAG: hypothetical protein D3924_08320 [Candidatus Electrothrix sp. AR4]|nr:hypothetical protein [Candidatus Electrothrix sp. AR4]